MDLIGMHFSFGFFLGSPVGVIPGTPQWMAPLEVLLGGFLLWIFLLKISMIPFVDFLILIMGLLGLDYILHKWNHVCCELLHLWRKFLACWIVAGTILLCLMFISLFFLDVCLTASVVFRFWSYLPAFLSMWCPLCSIFWPIINYYYLTWWS